MYRVHYGEAYWRRPEVLLMKNDIKLFFISMRRVFFFPFSLFLFFFLAQRGSISACTCSVCAVSYHANFICVSTPPRRSYRDVSSGKSAEGSPGGPVPVHEGQGKLATM